MNKRFLALSTIMVLVLASGAMACHEMIIVHDNLGNPMSGLTVELSTACNWAPSPAEDDTDANGRSVNWPVVGSSAHPCTYYGQVVAGADGYVCDTGSDDNTGDQGYIRLTCTPSEDVPEFGILAAIGVLGLAGLFVYRKRQ